MTFKQYIIIAAIAASAGVFALDSQSGGGSEWKQAEEFFNNGEYGKCTEFFEKYVRNESGKNDTEKLKLAAAMLEYIRRSSADSVENTLKDAEKLSMDKSLSQENRLKEIEPFIIRAKEWKKHSVPQWLELSDSVLKTLSAIKDEADPTLAIRVLLMRCEVLYLRGEFSEAANELNVALEHYFPKNFKMQSLSAAQQKTASYILIVLGNQYEAMASAALEKKDKEKYYSASGASYIKALEVLKPDTAEYEMTAGQIFLCADALRLLGYQLKIPSALKRTEVKDYPMIQEMLTQKRYGSALKTITAELEKIKDTAPEAAQLLLLQIKSLNGLKKYSECAQACSRLEAFLDRNKQMIPELVQIADGMKKDSAAKEALDVYSIIAGRATEEPDYAKIVFECADLSLTFGRTVEAAKYFEILAEKSKVPHVQSKAFSNAARCRYELKEYEKAFVSAEKSLALSKAQGNRDFESEIILVQAALHIGRNSIAEVKLDELLKINDLDPKYRAKMLLLSGLTAQRMEKPEMADAFFLAFLNENQDSGSYFEILGMLKQIRVQAKDSAGLAELCALTTKAQGKNPTSCTFIIETSESILAFAKAKDALDAYAKLADIPNIPPGILLNAADDLSSEKYDTARIKSDSLAYKLLGSKKPEMADAKNVREIYFRLAALALKLNYDSEAEQQILALLKTEKIYRYAELKLMHIELLKKNKRYKEAVAICQELSIRNVKEISQYKLTYEIAELNALNGEHKKAIAYAWGLVPADGKPNDSAQNEWTEKALRLICTSAESVKSEEDALKSTELYRKIYNKELK